MSTELSTSESHENSIVIAVIDNNSWEVGIAEIDFQHPTKLFVSQITDDRTFSTCLQRLQEIQPKEILIPDSHSSRSLAEILRNHFGSRVTALTRSFFNETRGGELMNDLNKSPIQSKQHLQSHYLGRASACALLTYVERIRGGEPLSRLVVKLDPWIEACGRLQMDFTTIKSLELVANRRTGGKEGTLFSVLKKTRTAMGNRLLRGQLISPPALLPTISARLDALEEIVLQQQGCEASFEYSEALSALSRMCDFDRLCSKFSTQPTKFSVRELKSEIEGVIGVREFTVELTKLLAGLDSFHSDFWESMKSDLQAPKFVLDKLHKEIGEITSPPVESSSSDHYLQDIFCVKADLDGMLDVARLAFVQVIADMHDLLAQLQESSGIPKIELKRVTCRGYHLSIPRTFESGLPSYFVQAVRQKKFILCTTAELASLNNRQARLESEILTLTAARLRPLREMISESLPILLQCSESVALCDMMLSFAELAARSDYTRPIFETDGRLGEIHIENMRHPVLETMIDSFEPRTLSLSSTQRLMLVMGENCAGKTTFLTQTALVCIMAQLGCYVPASLCRTIVISRICTRLDTDDALNQNASTFSLEMEETAHILEASENMKEGNTCLILIDELGRGTSTRDGLALSAATAEYLIGRPSARVLFSTHFIRLKELANQYPERIRCFTVKADDDSSLELDENGGYGIRLAQICGMPQEVISRAESFREILIAHFKSKSNARMALIPESTSQIYPVVEVFQVLRAIENKTRIAGERDYPQAKKLFEELKARIL